MATPFTVAHQVSAEQFERFLEHQLEIARDLHHREIPWILSATGDPEVFVSEVRTPEALTAADKVNLARAGQGFPLGPGKVAATRHVSGFDLLLTARLDLEKQAVALRDTAAVTRAIAAGLRDCLPVPLKLKLFALAVSLVGSHGSTLIAPNLREFYADDALRIALDAIPDFVAEETTSPWPVLPGSDRVFPEASAEITAGMLVGWYGSDATVGPTVGPVRLLDPETRPGG